jgi:hypothetical protein
MGLKVITSRFPTTASPPTKFHPNLPNISKIFIEPLYLKPEIPYVISIYGTLQATGYY